MLSHKTRTDPKMRMSATTLKSSYYGGTHVVTQITPVSLLSEQTITEYGSFEYDGRGILRRLPRKPLYKGRLPSTAVDIKSTFVTDPTDGGAKVSIIKCNPDVYHLPNTQLTGPIGAQNGWIRFDGYDFNSLNWSNNQAASITEAYKRLNSAKVEGGVFLGELGETLRFLKNPLKGLLQHAGTLAKRLNRHMPVQMKRDLMSRAVSGSEAHNLSDMICSSSTLAAIVSDWWLANRYAINPMKNDVEDAIMLFETELDDDDLSTQRGRASAPTVESSVMIANNETGFRVYWNGVEKLKMRSQTGIMFLKNLNAVYYHPEAQRLASLGLAPWQVPSTLYELIPGSFMLDWFVGVGDWLKAYEPNPFIDILETYTSTRISIERRITYASALSTSVSGVPIQANVQPVESRCEMLVRRVNQPLPGRPLLKVPKLVNAYDSLALVMANMPKLFKR